MIGNVVSVPVTTVTLVFNYILINVKVLAKRVYVRPEKEQFESIVRRLRRGFGTRGISKQTLQDLQVTEGPEWMPQTSKKRKYHTV